MASSKQRVAVMPNLIFGAVARPNPCRNSLEMQITGVRCAPIVRLAVDHGDSPGEIASTARGAPDGTCADKADKKDAGSRTSSVFPKPDSHSQDGFMGFVSAGAAGDLLERGWPRAGAAQ